MARMYGKTKYTFFNSCRRGCCYIDIDKNSIKRQEEQQWQQDYEEEQADG